MFAFFFFISKFMVQKHGVDLEYFMPLEPMCLKPVWQELSNLFSSFVSV